MRRFIYAWLCSMRLVRALLFACLLRPDGASTKNVAVVIAGLFRGTPETAAEYERALVAPLLRVNWTVHTFLGGFAENETAWRSWLSGSASNRVTFVRLVPDAQKSNESTQYFSACAQVGYGIRNAHLEDTWAAAKASGVQFDYAVKTRNDVAYGPDQFLRPCWLASLTDNVVLVNDKELCVPPFIPSFPNCVVVSLASGSSDDSFPPVLRLVSVRLF